MTGAPIMTNGTQIAVKLSMALCVLVGWSRYRLTRSIRLDSLVSSPPAWARMTRGPRTSTRPASTKSSGLTGIGIGSPVRGALSIEPVPSTTTPSTGTTSPERTSTMSPGSMASTGVSSSSWQFATTRDRVSGCSTFSVRVSPSSGLLSSSLALRGSLSSPPCIDSRALSRALSSRWAAKPTSPTTIRASAHSCR